MLFRSGFLTSYDIAKSKGTAGLVIGFKPGAAFFEDYNRFYRHRARSAARAAFQPGQREIGDPLKLAYLFAEKRTGQKVTSVAFVSSKDVETAKLILAEIAFDQTPAFLDFALSAARETNFDVQTLGGLRQYLARFKARQHAQASARQEDLAKRDDESQRVAYDGYRRKEATAIYQSLTIEEQQKITTFAERAAARFDGTLRRSMTDFYRVQITAQRHSGRIRTREEWRAAALAA